MARMWIDDADQSWEPLEGRLPEVLLDKHPEGKFLAMQMSVILATLAQRAAVWEYETGRIEWNPSNANAICWIENGSQVLVLEENPTPSPDCASTFASPLQREYKHCLRQLSWPQRELLSSIDVEFPTGWPVDIVPSPSEKVAYFVWEDQHEAGIELVTWKDGELQQVSGHGYSGYSNLIQGPVFSPDGRYIAISYGEGIWWSDELYEPSPGGWLQVGWVTVGEVASGVYTETEVATSVPEGWLPDDPEDIWNEFLSLPSFIDNQAFEIVLPTGMKQDFSIRADASEGLVVVKLS